MADFESAYKIVCELVRDFKGNETRYLSSQYQEAEVRRDFIDKFFDALGWDVYHRTQKNPYEQEVKVEKGISIGKAQKRADYAFYITPEYRQPKFFAEAKKPSRNLKNADDYFQTIRYGWNANTKIAVLTDFEEFHILDCRFKPNINNVLENPNHKRFVYADYTDSEKFKEIYYLFSRNEVAKNSLEKYSENFSKIKGKTKTTFKNAIQAIDDDFLEYIDEVRERLAKAFKKTDINITSEELTEATQRTIDRLVFIRFLEDKLIEPEYYISELGKKGNSWIEFITVCKKLDAKYNGIVFKKHFIDEQNFQGPEQGTFKKICDEMSNLNSPYDFNAIPIHILGSIYERFLGKVVNATSQRVKVEEKPEVRKAGGVYYTPKYIVDYIVENTVGKLIQGKTIAEISKLRFADIACGSGSFLIGVFETLLKYHTEYYQLHHEQAKKDGCINKDGQWILSIKQKQKILLNNIYGVDIDNQAVEVTQLSLALKMLEDESTATANEMQVLFHEKILPDLSKNIVCGNSLIGTDILQGKMFPSEEERKLNPMDFETTFPEIMKNGGFDAIVGNPPYVNAITLVDIFKTSRDYLDSSEKYNTLYQKWDLYIAFIEKGLKLLKSNGSLSMIIPYPFVNQLYAKIIRKFIINKYDLREISDISNHKIFKDATVNNCILFIDNKISTNSVNITNLIDGFFKTIYIKTIDEFVQNEESGNWNTKSLKFKAINKSKRILGELCFVSKGMVLNADENKAKGLFKKEDLISNVFSNLHIKKYLEAKDMDKYIVKKLRWLEWDTKRVPSLISRPTFPELYEQPKILINKIGSIKATLDNDKLTCDQTVRILVLWRYLTGISNNSIDNSVKRWYKYPRTQLEEYSLNYKNEYIIGILNSKIGTYLLNEIRGEGNIDINPEYLKNIPIPEIEFNNTESKQSHDHIVELVKQMLDAKKQLQIAKTDRDKTYYERRCSDLDSAIDSEVYKLYGLTEEEIKIVENN